MEEAVELSQNVTLQSRVSILDLRLRRNGTDEPLQPDEFLYGHVGLGPTHVVREIVGLPDQEDVGLVAAPVRPSDIR